MSGTDRRDFDAVILAMQGRTVTIDEIRDEIGLNYGRAYERVKAMRAAGVVATLRHSGNGRPALYRLAMEPERAISVMRATRIVVDRYDPKALERAWPAPLLRAAGQGSAHRLVG